MSKFKVGDRVRITCGLYTGCGLDVGSVHSIQEIVDGWRIMLKAAYPNGRVDFYGFSQDHVEPVTHTNALTPGETYTSRNGRKWECIFVRDGKAWMVGVYDGKADGSAYDFDVDGTASWVSECDRAPYNIVFEPVRETYSKVISVDGEPARVRFDVVDGRFDQSSLCIEWVSVT